MTFSGKFFFSSKVPESLLVLFNLVEKHFPVIFLAVLHFVSEKNEDTISKHARWTQRSETRRNRYLNFHHGWACVNVAQAINARAGYYLRWSFDSVGSNPTFSSFFLAFFSLFSLLSFCSQEKSVCRFKLPNNASQIHWFNAGFEYFLLLTTRLSGRVFLIDWNDLLKIVAQVRHQALFETIIVFTIASLNGWFALCFWEKRG